MISLLYGPEWFYGKDVFIDAISVFVLILIASFSLKYYKIRRGKNYLFLSLSFFLLASSFLIKILINIATNYISVDNVKNLLSAHLMNISFTDAYALFPVGVFLYRFSALIGLYFLYSIYRHSKINLQSILNFGFIGYLLAMLTFFAYQYQSLFHLTSTIMLSLITLFYWKQYTNKKKYSGKKITLYSFGIITASQATFAFVELNQYIYVIGEIIQLVGHLLLLITFITILFDHGRKKNKG